MSATERDGSGIAADVRHVTRRRFIVGSLAAGFVVAACGGDDDDSAEAGGGGGSGFPRTVDTARGPLEIDARPARIVTLAAEVDAAVALGVMPVATSRSFNDPTGIDPWLRGKLDDHEVELLDLADGVPFEQVAKARPDLILAGSHYQIEADYDQLADIAPVLTHMHGLVDDTWQDQTRLIGEALGAEDAAEDAIAEVEARIERIRGDHPEWQGKSFAVGFQFEPGSVRVYEPDTFGPLLLKSLGFEIVPAIANASSADVSFEQLSVLDADVLIMSYGSDDLRADLEANPVFAGLPVVRDGRHLTIDLDVSTAMTVPSVLRVPYVLDHLVPELETIFA